MCLWPYIIAYFQRNFYPNEQIIYIQNTTYMNVSEFVLKHVKYVPETESMLLLIWKINME